MAAELGISKWATWKRLTDLFQAGLLEKQPSSGLQIDAWSLSDEGRVALEGEPAPNGSDAVDGAVSAPAPP